jgi:transcriptional regulator with XRE-family HTH domain
MSPTEVPGGLQSADAAAVGERLASERGRLLMTQERFATECGVSHKVQRGYERERALAMSLAYLSRADRLGADVQFIATGRRNPAVWGGASRQHAESSIQERVRAERSRLGLALLEMAAIGDVSRSTQAAYESSSEASQGVPDLGYCLQIAERGADLRFLVTGYRTDAAEAEGAPSGPGGRLQVLASPTLSQLFAAVDLLCADERGVMSAELREKVYRLLVAAAKSQPHPQVALEAMLQELVELGPRAANASGAGVKEGV